MTKAHRMVILIINEDDTPAHELEFAVRNIKHYYPRIISHDTRDIDRTDLDVLNRQNLTPSEFDRWFSANRPATLTVQTVISLIQIARHDVAGKAWLMRHVVPALRDNHLATALTRIAETRPRDFGTETRPTLVRIVFDAVCEIIQDQQVPEKAVVEK